MQPDAIYSQLSEIFREVFADPTLVITPDTKSSDVAGWDSGRMIELIVAAETEFGIRFSTRDVDGMARVADFVRLIAQKTGSTP